MSVVAPRLASVASCRASIFPFASCISVRRCFIVVSHSPFALLDRVEFYESDLLQYCRENHIQLEELKLIIVLC
ncbi:hypothetical protein PIB30_042436 [Stylosanthes scabra]|uniref:Secreted protein n=1 Tax=Stylosanthes scabra TaxID=79078 RepID=A0ABU6SGI8_9FABA|nr:hypothetical protein [Stylosanthes scabra]